MGDIASLKRGRVGLVVFKGQSASTLQTPTTNLNLVVKKLRGVGASDFTPLASGMFEARRVLRNDKNKNRDAIPVLVIISDGITNISLESPISSKTRSRFLNHAQADVIDVSYLLRREGVRTLVINPSHVPANNKESQRYKMDISDRLGKIWYAPTELLMEISKITDGYYYGIGEKGELEEIFLTDAFSLFESWLH